MSNCVFCKKAKDKRVSRFGDCLVFKPLNPVVKGHLLVIHRIHTDDFSGDYTISNQVVETAFWYAKRYKEFNLITSQGENATQSIGHLHIHIIPRKKGDGLMLPWSTEPLAKQRTQILKEVKEIVDPMECTIKRNHPEHCHYPIALTDVLKKLKELSNE